MSALAGADRCLRRLVLASGVLLLLSGYAEAQNPKPKSAPSTAPQPKPSPGFVDTVLKVLGISDAPGTLKGPGEEVTSGALWVTDLASNRAHPVTNQGRYRSPVFVPGNNAILALNGTDLVRFTAGSGEMKTLHPVAGVTKLVGCSSEDPDKVLVLEPGGAGGHPRIGLLSVRSGSVAPLAYDSRSSADLQMVENLEGWTRKYAGKEVYVRRQTKQALSGIVEWSDVFLKTNGKEPIDVSQCGGSNCGQPSLSADGRLLVFVKSESE